MPHQVYFEVARHKRWPIAGMCETCCSTQGKYKVNSLSRQYRTVAVVLSLHANANGNGGILIYDNHQVGATAFRRKCSLEIYTMTFRGRGGFDQGC